MKKLLSLLTSISLLSSSGMSIIAYNNGTNDSENDDKEESKQNILTIINKLNLGEVILKHKMLYLNKLEI